MKFEEVKLILNSNQSRHPKKQTETRHLYFKDFQLKEKYTRRLVGRNKAGKEFTSRQSKIIKVHFPPLTFLVEKVARKKKLRLEEDSKTFQFERRMRN